MKLKEIRNLIDHSIWVGGRTTRVVNAILEADAIETTFAEIAKLQQRILGDSKTIGGTAHNSPMAKFPTTEVKVGICHLFTRCTAVNKGHAGCYSNAPCFK